MNNLRFKALEKIAQQENVAFSPTMNRLDSFAANVFDERKLQNYLSKPAFKEMMLAIKKGTQLNSDILSGHQSTLLVQLGNISQRTGRALKVDPSNGRILNDKEAMKLWSREYEKGWEPKV